MITYTDFTILYEKTGEKLMEQAIAQLTSDAAHEYFKQSVTTINNLYIDMEVLQDFRLGALLNLITTQAEFDYILFRLGEYSKRLDERVMCYFPAIDTITDEDIDAFIVDSSNHRKLGYISPMTQVYQDIPGLANSILKLNEFAPDGIQLLTFHIGINSIVLDPDLKQNIINQFKKLGNDIKIVLYDTSLSEINKEVFETFDMFIVNNIKTFMYDKTIQKYLSDGLFFNKRLLTHPYMEDSTGDKKVDEQRFHNTKIMLDVYCDFDYIERKVTLS